MPDDGNDGGEGSGGTLATAFADLKDVEPGCRDEAAAEAAAAAADELDSCCKSVAEGGRVVDGGAYMEAECVMGGVGGMLEVELALMRLMGPNPSRLVVRSMYE